MHNSNERIIKHKVGLPNLGKELGTVSKACQMMGLSGGTFYRYKSAVEEGGVESLMDRSRRPNIKNRTDEATEAAVLSHAVDDPAHGQLRTSNALGKKGFSFRRAGCAVSGYATAWAVSVIACGLWKRKWSAKASC